MFLELKLEQINKVVLGTLNASQILIPNKNEHYNYSEHRTREKPKTSIKISFRLLK
ncbi:hypothetical protein [Clostridium sp.]|uniref:hypothetical protein n=1 Tax=Clostridium sp. TaxID=1506 RepID=UPI001A5CCF15|nr:hypothetical protein [Clostridium sp.]MBK5236553.1 hypothetical protein [Clostridium sp.]